MLDRTLTPPTAIDLELGRVDLDRRVIETPSGPRSLTPNETALLGWLAARPEQAFDSPTLLSTVWGYAPTAQSRTVYATINRLRAKIELEPSRPRHVVTVVETGYAFYPLPSEPAADAEGAPPPESGRRRTNLGAERSPIVGRDPLLARLHGRFGAGARLVTLVGLGGVGKTRVAQVYGRSQVGRWPGGVWFCDLSEARSTADVWHTLAAAPVSLRTERCEQDLSRRRATLLVLDNFEQVVDCAPATVGRWLADHPDLGFLVTSRRPLAIPEEHLVEVPPLAREDAVELLVGRAATLGVDWAAWRVPALEAIVDRLDRLPLALELAAARARSMDPDELLERLGERFLLAAPRASGRPSRQHSLDRTIRWSWELLDPWERAALAQLSVFRGGFSLGSAEAVLDLLDGPGAPWLPDVVAALRDHSLIHRDARQGAWLALYDSVRQFAAARLAEEPELGGSSDPSLRHAEHFAGWGTDEGLGALVGPRGARRRQALAANLDNLRAAFEWGRRSGRTDLASGSALAEMEVLLTQGPFEQAADLANSALDLEALDPRRRTRLLRSRGRALELAGRASSASAVLSEALHSARATGQRREEGLVLLNRGVLARADGRLDAAVDDFSAAREVFGELGDRSRQALARLAVGNVERERGRVPEAREQYRAAQLLARESGDRRAEGAAHAALAQVEWTRGAHSRARRHFESASARHREVADRHSEAVLQGNFGVFLMELEEVAGARTKLEQAVASLDSSQSPAALGAFLGALGELHAREGRTDDASEAVERGEALLRAAGDQTELGMVLCRRGRIALAAGDAEGASAALDEARTLAAKHDLGPESRLGRAVAGLASAMLDS